MARKVTITLEDDVLDFVDQEAAREGRPNRSGFINRVLAREKRRALQAELEAAYRRDARDPAYQEEIAAWDAVAGDGIDA